MSASQVSEMIKPDSTNQQLVSERDYHQIVGWVLQVALGIMLSFSALHNLSKYVSLPIDDLYLLLAFMSLVLGATSLPRVPKLQFHFKWYVGAATVLALMYYVVFAARCWIYFHRGCLLYHANDYIAMTALAAAFFPVAVGLIFILRNRMSQGTALPLWGLVFLAFGLIGMPLNHQLGYLPVYMLGFIVAFFATFLARSPKVLFLTIVVGNLALLAYALGKYPTLGGFPTARFGDVIYGLQHPNEVGHYMVFIFASAIALLYYYPAKFRYWVYLAIAFFTMCFLLLQSRGGMIGVIVMIGTYVAMSKPFKKVGTAGRYRTQIFVLVMAVVVLLCIITYFTLQRMPSDERPGWFRVAYDQFLRFPWTGSGIGWWLAHFGYASPHNQLLEIASNMGVVGLLIALLVGYCCVKQMRGISRHLSSENDRKALVICAAAVTGYLISLLVDICPRTIYTVIPALLGTWCGVLASQNSLPVSSTGKHLGRRFVYVLALVLGLSIATSIAYNHTPPANRKSLADALSYKYCRIRPLDEDPGGDISGQITDNNKHPLAGATVILSPLGLKCIADNNGAFRFHWVKKKPVGSSHNYHIKVHYGGYRDKSVEATQVTYGCDTIYPISLELK